MSTIARERHDPLFGGDTTGWVWPGLGEREVQVIRLLALGCNTAAIAHQLSYSESTVKKSVHTAVVQLGARNRVHVVALAIRNNMI